MTFPTLSNIYKLNSNSCKLTVKLMRSFKKKTPFLELYLVFLDSQILADTYICVWELKQEPDKVYTSTDICLIKTINKQILNIFDEDPFNLITGELWLRYVYNVGHFPVNKKEFVSALWWTNVVMVTLFLSYFKHIISGLKFLVTLSTSM